MEYLRTLNSISRGEEHIAGERAVDLAILSKKSFDIPLSFVLTNNAFEDFIIANKLQFKIAKILNKNTSLGDKYVSVREEMLKGKFPELMITELHESFESLVVTKNSNVHDLLKDDNKPFVTLVISPNYALNAESKEGIIINVHDFEDLLEAVKECWACLFTADMQAHRKKIGLLEKNLNSGIIIHNMKTCESSFETYSAMIGDNEKIKVHAYLGFPDLSGRVEKDEFRLNREFLKIEYQGITIQTHRLARGLDDKLDRVSIGIMGEEQKINDRTVMEIARLAKKASNNLGSHVKLTGYVKDDEVMIYICDKINLDSSNLDFQQVNEIINEEIINDEVITEEKLEEPIEDAEEIIDEDFEEENIEAIPEPVDDEEIIEEDVEEIEEQIPENEDQELKEEINDWTKEQEEDSGNTIIEEENYEGELDLKQESESEETLNDEEKIETEDFDYEKIEDLEIPVPKDDEEIEESIEDDEDQDDDFIVNNENKNNDDNSEEEIETPKLTKDIIEDTKEPSEDEDDDFIFSVNEEQENTTPENDKTDEEKNVPITSRDEIEIEEYKEEPSNDEKEKVSEEKENVEYVIEEDEDDNFYDAFDKVKQALLNKYEERFRKLAPDDLVEVYLELNNEIIIPFEEEIGLLLRIFEQEEEYTDEQKNKILKIIDNFIENI